MTSPLASVVIRGWGSVSALGFSAVPTHAAATTFRPDAASGLPVAALPPTAEAALAALRQRRPAYRALDRSVLLALLATERAVEQAHWTPTDSATLAVSLGSSRGATERLETFHAEFLHHGAVPTTASPLTTLGNVASWVADSVGATGAAISHSSTCSTALQALGNAVAWLKAGLAERFLAGGTEAPLTSFSLAQMQALRIYSPHRPDEFPCRPGAGGASSFVLGEGAAVLALEAVPAAQLQPGDLLLESVGFGFEATGTKTGLTPDGQHFQQAMRQALQLADKSVSDVDLLVLHSPGTAAGDASEHAAVKLVFGADVPACTSNKWLLGHTLGASAALSLDFALHLLKNQVVPTPLPFDTWLNHRPAPRRIQRVMINAAGFGGNAASALVSVVG
ncbi:beta-ketoacyl synthase N-terminal-like domain-containing protein [Hymenobacter koreensis]|uniref:Beta-ketoacyl synthase N-terminal-like domain-containing protein n=1 Tax=Hymenobacter koreensis TaxID=1084523 RepID=A0ABP8IYN4_9BACT